jgi:hypothetical protein
MARKATPKKQETEKFECLKCRRQIAETDFYINNNKLFSSKRSIVCKKCLSDYIGEKNSIGYLDRVKMVLAILNKPFISDLWESRSSDWAKYIPQLSSFPQYKGMTFADSDFNKNIKQITDNAISEEPQSRVNINTFTSEELNELQDFWGRGFTVDEYYFLTNEYQRL